MSYSFNNKEDEFELTDTREAAESMEEVMHGPKKGIKTYEYSFMCGHIRESGVIKAADIEEARSQLAIEINLAKYTHGPLRPIHGIYLGEKEEKGFQVEFALMALIALIIVIAVGVVLWAVYTSPYSALHTP